ncbi:E2/UBC family protein [Salegentibacter maritimus]|uniref:E2/UBC family protein n=1 Tax=Salegentibacter maritimus TaxID=2794347 RepID=UPI0018E499F3|nr:E2/UBC family protein [Salegentibacter maritimus]MBI6117965.1 hypothetical protein [Salegentibacter maritimus]
MKYGTERLIDDLQALGYKVVPVVANNGKKFVQIDKYEVKVGQFKGRVIDLAIPAPNQYPRSVGPSIHVKSDPMLLDKKDTIKGTRNIINSPLGEPWRYWSFRFNLNAQDPTKDLISQINGIFKNI